MSGVAGEVWLQDTRGSPWVLFIYIITKCPIVQMFSYVIFFPRLFYLYIYGWTLDVLPDNDGWPSVWPGFYFEVMI